MAVSRPKERLLILSQNNSMQPYNNILDEAIEKTRNLGTVISKENVIKLEESIEFE